MANNLKVEAAKHERVATIMRQIGQKVHIGNTRLNVFAIGYKFVRVKPLADGTALNEGVSFLSDTFVFVIGSIVILVEVTDTNPRARG